MMLYLTFIKHLLIHLGNNANPNLSSQTIPKLPAKLGNQISVYVPGRFAKISRVILTIVILSTNAISLKLDVYFESDVNRIW